MTDSRVAIVTGAPKGIGAAIADALRQDGVTVIGVSRSVDRSEFTRPCDLKKENEVRDLMADVIDSFGRIDILVNNAGICTFTDILEQSEAEWDDVMDTNLKGTFFCCKHVLSHMKERQYGKIVNVSSIAGRNRSIVASVAYTCSKHGMVGLTRQLALHYAKFNINVNCVCPSQTKTEMLASAPKEEIDRLVGTIPARRLGEPAEVASAVRYLCSDEAAYVNGAILDINGGQ